MAEKMGSDRMSLPCLPKVWDSRRGADPGPGVNDNVSTAPDPSGQDPHFVLDVLIGVELLWQTQLALVGIFGQALGIIARHLQDLARLTESKLFWVSLE